VTRGPSPRAGDAPRATPCPSPLPGYTFAHLEWDGTYVARASGRVCDASRLTSGTAIGVDEQQLGRKQRKSIGWMLAAALAALQLWAVAPALAQTRPSGVTPPPPPAPPPRLSPEVTGTERLRGRPVENVRILNNAQVPTSIIMNLVRTRPGDPFDPATVEEDYQRIYGMKKFSNVEAKVEPTARGVNVIFTVTEQRQIKAVRFRGNQRHTDVQLLPLVDIKSGEAIDRFRISLARQAIERYYHDDNFSFAHVEIDEAALTRDGDLVFVIVEGPNVKVRRVKFIGNKSFTDDKLKDQVRTKSWIWIIRHGTYDEDVIEDDVASVRRWYEAHGFFDVRVGRKVIFSPDNSEVQVNFLVDEGVRYRVDRVSFVGNASLSETQLRSHMKLVEGQYFSQDVLLRDVRELVRAYSPFGFIYQPQSNDPAYLRIKPDTVFRKEAGQVDLVYNISEGRPFHIGRILVRGNTKTQDKVVLREMRVSPGEQYNSGAIQDAGDRLKALGYFTSVNITPIGDDPETRDVLVEANDRDAHTATFTIGAGVNSNGGVGGNLTYEQRNFDIANVPRRLEDFWNGTGFVGAGQQFRASFEPGTRQTNASLRFSDPWVFDQPYSFTGEAYLRNRVRESYVDQRLGGRLTLGKRFNYIWSAQGTLRAEIIDIGQIEDKPIRAQEILDLEGQSSLVTTALQIRRDTTNRGLLPSKGTTTTASWESAGWLGGDFDFNRYSLSWDAYHTLSEDLLDRKTILALHTDFGYTTQGTPFMERYYAGGLGSIRGFSFRGVSPRSGPAKDPVGGDFLVTGTAEVSFPVIEDNLRGVVFTDVGTVEPDFRIGTIRTSVGAGIRLTLPFLGQTPIAIDFAVPITKDKDDDTQFISFSLGISQ
jgi:outer membrane protein insertion porin family